MTSLARYDYTMHKAKRRDTAFDRMIKQTRIEGAG